MASHYLELPDARTLATPDYRLTQQAIAAVADPYGLAVVHGPSGTGKTYGVGDSLTALPCPTFDLEFPPRCTPKQLTAGLLNAVTGQRIAGTHIDLQRELVDVLAGTQVVIKLDEAQHFDHACVETLRYLFDRDDNQLGLVLVGGNKCWTMLERFPALRSRVTGRVEFRPLDAEAVRTFVPQLHPVYERVPASLLADVDRLYAGGRLREWTIFTKNALDLMERADEPELTQEIADLVLQLMRGLAHV